MYSVTASSAVSSSPVPRTSGSCSPSFSTSTPYWRRMASFVVGLPDDDPVHVLNAGVDPRLRRQLLRVEQGHVQLAHGVVGPLPVVPRRPRTRRRPGWERSAPPGRSWFQMAVGPARSAGNARSCSPEPRLPAAAASPWGRGSRRDTWLSMFSNTTFRTWGVFSCPPSACVSPVTSGRIFRSPLYRCSRWSIRSVSGFHATSLSASRCCQMSALPALRSSFFPAYRPHNLHISRPAARGRALSFRCSSSPHCAGQRGPRYAPISFGVPQSFSRRSRASGPARLKSSTYPRSRRRSRPPPAAGSP